MLFRLYVCPGYQPLSQYSRRGIFASVGQFQVEQREHVDVPAQVVFLQAPWHHFHPRNEKHIHWRSKIDMLYISVVKMWSGSLRKNNLSREVTMFTSFYLGSSNLSRHSSPLVLTWKKENNWIVLFLGISSLGYESSLGYQPLNLFYFVLLLSCSATVY